MTRLRSNSANVVDNDTSDSDVSFTQSKQLDDDTHDDTHDADDDDDIEIVLPRNVSNEIPRSSVFRRVSTEVVPPESARKVSGDKTRKVTFDSSPSSSKKTVVSAKGILKKPEVPGSPYAVVTPVTPTQVLTQDLGTENSGLSRLHLPRRPSRTLEECGKPRQVAMESSSDETSSPATTSLAKEIARELVKEVKLLQPVDGLQPVSGGNVLQPVSVLQPEPVLPPTDPNPNLAQVHRIGRLGVRRRQQAWRQRRGVRKAQETDLYVDSVLHEVNRKPVGSGESGRPLFTASPTQMSPEASPGSSPRAGGREDAPSFYWDPSAAFNFYTSTEWWEDLRSRAQAAPDGSRSYRKQLFLTVDGFATWVYSTVTGCVARVQSRVETVQGLVSRLQWWSSDGGAVPMR